MIAGLFMTLGPNDRLGWDWGLDKGCDQRRDQHLAGRWDQVMEEGVDDEVSGRCTSRGRPRSQLATRLANGGAAARPRILVLHPNTAASKTSCTMLKHTADRHLGPKLFLQPFCCWCGKRVYPPSANPSGGTCRALRDGRKLASVTMVWGLSVARITYVLPHP